MQLPNIIADSYIEKIGNRGGVFSLYDSFVRSGNVTEVKWHYKFIEKMAGNHTFLIKLFSFIPWYKRGVVSFYYRNAVGCVLFVHDFTDELTYREHREFSTLIRIFRKCLSILVAGKLIFITNQCYQEFKLNHPFLFKLVSHKEHIIHHNCAAIEFYDVRHIVKNSNSDSIRFIYYGRILPYKNLDYCLNRIVEVKQDLVVDISIITPDQGAAEVLFRKYSGCGLNIEVMPPKELDDLIESINLSDVVLYPSLQEGFGIPLIESVLCKKWIILSDRLNVAAELPYENQIYMESIDFFQIEAFRGLPNIPAETVELLNRKKADWAARILRFCYE
jgi:glycosyltransferase involved in cell wall biosynthesis